MLGKLCSIAPGAHLYDIARERIMKILLKKETFCLCIEDDGKQLLKILYEDKIYVVDASQLSLIQHEIKKENKIF